MKRLILLTMMLTISITACKKDQENSNEVSIDNNGPVGSAAHAFLSGSKYETLNIEIISMQGFSLNSNSITNLEGFLAKYLNKPQGINIFQREIPAQGQSTYSIEDLQSLEQNHREFFNQQNSIAASIIIVDGEFADNSSVLGVAYKNTSMALFGEIIENNSGDIGEPTKSKLESTVLNHEFGHVLGLVNNGSPMVDNHESGNNSAHCNNENCLMYYAAETTDIASFLVGSNIPSLDNNCEQDLTANGGK